MPSDNLFDFTPTVLLADAPSAIDSADLVSAPISGKASSPEQTVLMSHGNGDVQNSISDDQPLVTPESKVAPASPHSPPLGPGHTMPAAEDALYDSISSRSANLCDEGVQRAPTLTCQNSDFAYNQHNELIFDDSRLFPSVKDDKSADIYKFDTNDSDSLSHATLTVLVVHLTSPNVIDYNFICDFFVSYRKFVSSEHLLELLCSRMIWALQYINSDLDEHLTVGKQVLLRTFVVFRHWILNYFFDDFDSNIPLCDFFTETLNQITSESSLFNGERSQDNLVFETKIINDLKAHWIGMMCEFWNADISVDALVENGVMFQFKIPVFSEVRVQRKMQKSNTEASIHSNPSFRRSAMLLLYENKRTLRSHAFDNVNLKEACPRQSIQNLLLHYKLLRLSVNSKLRDIKSKALAKRHTLMASGATSSRCPAPVPDFPSQMFTKRVKSHKALRQTNRHNRMNMSNSSVRLKKVSARKSFQAAGATRQGVYPNQDDIEEQSDAEPEVCVSSSPSEAIRNTGFSTNGDVRLPAELLDEIRPPTPQIAVAHDQKTRYPMGGAPSDVAHMDMAPPKANTEALEIKRRNSVQRVVDAWKKLILSNTHLGHDPATGESATWEMVPMVSNTADDDSGTFFFCDAPTTASRQDTLSARVIDEIEFLIKHYNLLLAQVLPKEPAQKLGKSEALPLERHQTDQEDDCESLYLDPENEGSPLKKRSLSRSLGTHNVNAVFRGRTFSPEDADYSSPDINDLSDLNMLKIDNLISARECANILGQTLPVNGEESPKRSSFMTPASFNWSDMKDSYFETATPNDSELLYGDNGTVATNDSNNSDDVVTVEDRDGRDALETMIEGNAANGGLLSQQLSDIEINKMNDLSSDQRMSCSSNVWFTRSSLGSHPAQNTLMRSSTSTPTNIARYCEEIADLSIMNMDGCSTNNAHDKSRSTVLSTKRRNSDKSYLTYDSAFSAADQTVSSTQTKRSGSYKLKKKGGVKNMRDFAGSRSGKGFSTVSLPARADLLLLRMSTSSCILTERDHSIDSPVTTSSMDHLNQKAAHHHTQMTDTSIFSVESKNQSHGRRTAASSSGRASSSVAIQGMNSVVLRELAAIPDELMRSSDPILYALSKLEGKNLGKTSRTDSDSALDTTGESPDTKDGIENRECASDENLRCDINDAPITPSRSQQESRCFQGKLEFASLKKPSSRAETEQDLGNQWARLALANYQMLRKSLAVESVMKQHSHLSFVLCYDSKTLADHFTVIERDVLQDIDWMELMEKDWSHELTPVNSWLEIIANDAYFKENKGVNLVVARFNLTINWIISEIVLTTNQYERVCIVTRFIHIAERCFEMQNYSTLMQIILALTSSKLQGLNGTWQDLDAGDVSTLADLEECVSPMKNFGQLRERLALLTPSKGCIPFLGLYLSDLTFNAERPDYIRPNAPSVRPQKSNQLDELASDCDTVIHHSEDSEDSAEPVINFSKFRTTVSIIRSLFRCIEWSGNYTLETDPDLLSKCLYIRSLDEHEMNYCIANSNAGY